MHACVCTRTYTHTHPPHANSHTFAGTSENVPLSHTNTYILTRTHTPFPHAHTLPSHPHHLLATHTHTTLLPSHMKTIPICCEILDLFPEGNEARVEDELGGMVVGVLFEVVCVTTRKPVFPVIFHSFSRI